MIGCLGRVIIGELVNKNFNTNMKFLLSSPNFKNYPCRASESVPPGPELPESFRLTDLTKSSIISTRMKIGVLLYTSSVELWRGGGRADVSSPAPLQRFPP